MPNAKAKGKHAQGQGSPKPSGDDLRDDISAATKVKAEYEKVELKARQLIQDRDEQGVPQSGQPPKFGCAEKAVCRDDRQCGRVRPRIPVGGSQVHQKELHECNIEAALTDFLQN